MSTFLKSTCGYAPYLGLALASIVGWVDTTTTIVLAAVLIATWPASRRPCWPARSA